MPDVVTLTARPIPRGDGNPFTIGVMQEAPDRLGPYTDREEFDLGTEGPGAPPVDPDPWNPATRKFTTDQGTLDSGWWRVLWKDAANGQSTSEPEHRTGGSPGLPVSPTEARARSEWIRTHYPETPYDAQKEEDLENALVSATAMIESLTCRVLDESLTDPGLVTLAVDVTIRRAETLLMGSSAKKRTSRFGQRSLKSMTAGPYSETYFGPDDAAKIKRLDPEPEVHDLLWALATEECRDRWLELWGEYTKPAAASTEIAWVGFPGSRRY